MGRLQVGAVKLLLATAVLAKDPGLTEPGSHDNSAGCDCYTVSGAQPGYFQYYRYWDFRSIPNDGTNDYTVAPPVVDNSTGGQNTTSAFFNTDQWNNDWSIQNQVLSPDSPVPTTNTAQNVYITRNTSSPTNMTYLTLRAYRFPKWASISEVDSNQKNIFHSSIRARMRVIPNYNKSIPGVNASHPAAPGACVGLFTYKSDSQESDIEILTTDPIGHARYSNQPDFDPKTGNTVPGASTDAPLPPGIVWTDWHDHRIDWFDGVSRWYVDGILAVEKTLNVPTKPSGLVANLWSDGGQWTGNMSIGANVTIGIQWIESTFNVSGSNPSYKRHASASCKVGCSIDRVQTMGFPQVDFNNTVADAGIRSTMMAGTLTIGSLLTMWMVVFAGYALTLL